jgi:hypothetical protein
LRSEEVNKNAPMFWGICTFTRRADGGFDQDAAAPLGKGEMTILKDMENLDQEHEQYMQELKSGGQSDSD